MALDLIAGGLVLVDASLQRAPARHGAVEDDIKTMVARDLFSSPADVARLLVKVRRIPTFITRQRSLDVIAVDIDRVVAFDGALRARKPTFAATAGSA